MIHFEDKGIMPIMKKALKLLQNGHDEEEIQELLYDIEDHFDYPNENNHHSKKNFSWIQWLDKSLNSNATWLCYGHGYWTDEPENKPTEKELKEGGYDE